MLLGILWSLIRQIKPAYVFDWENAIALDRMQGNQASSQFEFGYIEIFCVPGVTSVFFLFCDSVFGDSLELNHANQESLPV